MSEWIDLSRPIEEGTSVYPGDPLFQASPFAECATDGFRGTRLVLGTHLGTHIDAPFHYFIDGETLDTFPLDTFFGRAACLDLRDNIARAAASLRFGRPVSLKVADLEPFEQILEEVPFIFLRTDWSLRLGESDYYTAFPSLSPELCDWLVDYPNLRILGLETPSLVSFPTDDAPSDTNKERKRPFHTEFADLLKKPKETSKTTIRLPIDDGAPLDELELCADAECHRILLGRRPPVLILEGLVSLDRLPCFTARSDERVQYERALTTEVACFPLPIKGLDGCPVRVAARRTLSIVG